MIFLTPRINKLTLLFQLMIIVLFAFSLYLYLASRVEERSIRHELERLPSQRVQLKQTLKTLAAYHSLLESNTALTTLPSSLNWEEVEFNWTSVSFAELLQRIDELSRQQKIFVLESFSARIQSGGKTSPRQTKTPAKTTGFPNFSDRIFHMRGYFLCPAP